MILNHDIMNIPQSTFMNKTTSIKLIFWYCIEKLKEKTHPSFHMEKEGEVRLYCSHIEVFASSTT